MNSGTSLGAMKIGSIAIALIAEYGEFWPSAISLTGSNCTMSSDAASSQRANRGRSGISPMPQLAREGIEKSGTMTPACRPDPKRSGIRPLQDPQHALAQDRRFRQQADDEVSLLREIEEEPGVHHHAVPLQQVNDQLLFGSR